MSKSTDTPTTEPTPLTKMKKTGQKIQESPFTQSIDAVNGEYPTDYFEIVSKKKRYTDSTAGECYFSRIMIHKSC